MPEAIGHILIAFGLTLAGFLSAFVLFALLASDTAKWLDRRSHDRAQSIESQLARTQRRLAAIRRAQASLHDACAHDAAVALIMESYRASAEASGSPMTSVVVNNTSSPDTATNQQP